MEFLENTMKLNRSKEAYDFPLLIRSILTSAEKYPTGRIYGSPSQDPYDYEALRTRVGQAMNMLRRAGVRAGDVVAVLDWDTNRYLELFFAIPMLGAVLHTVNIRLAKEQVLFTMAHAKDSFALVHPDFLPLLEDAEDSLVDLKGLILMASAPEANPDFELFGEYEELLNNEDSLRDYPDMDENSVATLFYTTGTTGDPKGVFFTHRQLVLHTLVCTAALSARRENRIFDSKDVYLPLTPMFHVHAWGIPYVATMLGTTQVYPDRFDPKSVLKQIRDHSVSFSHCVPAILQMLLMHPDSKETNLKGWKIIIGGSALSPGLAKAAMERGIEIYSGYGMSETCPVLTLGYVHEALRGKSMDAEVTQRIRAGIPLPFTEIYLETEDGLLSNEPEVSGEVVVRTPWLTMDYYQNEQAGQNLWSGGWLHTGDVGEFTKEGHLKITDRLKDVIKSGGEWVSSVELERYLSEVHGVQDVAVVGVQDEKWGERPICLYVAESDLEESMRAHLQEYVKAGDLSSWAVPSTMKRVDVIPKTSVGKIDKKVIRRELVDS